MFYMFIYMLYMFDDFFSYNNLVSILELVPTAQYKPEPGADHWLIDWWSADQAPQLRPYH